MGTRSAISVAGIRNRTLLATGGVCLVLALATPASDGDGSAAAIWLWHIGAMVPAYAIGLAALWLQPGNASAGWLVAVGAWLAIATAATRTLPQVLLDAGVHAHLASNVVQVGAMLATATALACLLVVFPDAAPGEAWRRRLVRALWALPGIGALLWVVARPEVAVGAVAWPTGALPNPAFIAPLARLAPLAESMVNARSWIWTIGALALLTRWRSATSRVRSQLKWPATAALTFALLLGALVFLQQLGLVDARVRHLPQYNGWVPGIAMLTGSMLVALVRHRIVEVDLWLRRTVLFGGMSALIATAYLGIAGLVGLAAGQRASVGVGILVTLAAIVVFEPARRHVETFGRRWIFGPAVAGDDMLRQLGNALEDTHDAARIADTLVAAVVDGLGLRWARIDVHADVDAAAVIAHKGSSSEDEHTTAVVVPLAHGDTIIGRLHCGPKRSTEFSSSDEDLLATLARQAALAITNVRLAAQLERNLSEVRRQADELAASRARIVEAQVSERRRIERDLHDGVQQDLVVTIAHLRLARSQLQRDVATAERTLAGVQDHVRSTLSTVRELTRGIHPLVLTHLGIVAALEAQFDRLPLSVDFHVAPAIEAARFGEQLEAAAYFVVCEGLTNIVKHAHTSDARVVLDTSGNQLVVEISDDGVGTSRASTKGTGIVGLTDRVASLGGTLSLESSPGQGTTLRAKMPLTRPASRSVRVDAS